MKKRKEMSKINIKIKISRTIKIRNLIIIMEIIKIFNKDTIKGKTNSNNSSNSSLKGNRIKDKENLIKINRYIDLKTNKINIVEIAIIVMVVKIDRSIKLCM